MFSVDEIRGAVRVVDSSDIVFQMLYNSAFEQLGSVSFRILYTN